MPLMTEAEYPSLTSGTITPMVKLRCVRSERARKLGRYLNFFAASKIRSLVSCGIESATLDRLMTRDTVAGERLRCSARVFKLIGFRAVGLVRSNACFVGFGFRVVTERSLAQ